MFNKISTVVIGLLQSLYGITASVVSGVINTVIQGTLIVRQSGSAAVAGTDEIQISHDGTDGLIEVKSGKLYLQDGVSDTTLTIESNSGPQLTLRAGLAGNGVLAAGANLSGTTIRSGDQYGWDDSATHADGRDTGMARAAAAVVKVTNGSTGQGELWTNGLLHGGLAGAATSSRRIILKKTGIADNTATSVITVTVPNANHAACIKLTLMSSNGSTDAFESTRCAEGLVVLARTTGANVVPAVAALDLAQIATVAAGATHTLAYGVSAVTGAVGASNTFDIQVTIDDSGNLGSNQVVVLADLINSEATGVTMAAA